MTLKSDHNGHAVSLSFRFIVSNHTLENAESHGEAARTQLAHRQKLSDLVGSLGVLVAMGSGISEVSQAFSFPSSKHFLVLLHCIQIHPMATGALACIKVAYGVCNLASVLSPHALTSFV